MNVLVACECSQVVCSEFIKRGHNAYSCDIQSCKGEYPDRHIKCDVAEVLNLSWDLIIAHPPCTYLTKASACRMYHPAGVIDQGRYKKALAAKEFFMMFFENKCQRICIENPIPLKIVQLPKCNQIVQPYYFGDPFMKTTCLWLKNLPLLVPTNILNDYRNYIASNTSCNKGHKEKYGVSLSGGSSYIRSKFFSGIASAMADQWG